MSKLKNFFKSSNHIPTQKYTNQEYKEKSEQYLSNFKVDKFQKIDHKTGEPEVRWNRVTKQYEPQFRYLYFDK